MDSVPSTKGCDMLDEELTHKQWDENDGESFADSNNFHILIK